MTINLSARTLRERVSSSPKYIYWQILKREVRGRRLIILHHNIGIKALLRFNVVKSEKFHLKDSNSAPDNFILKFQSQVLTRACRLIYKITLIILLVHYTRLSITNPSRLSFNPSTVFPARKKHRGKKFQVTYFYIKRYKIIFRNIMQYKQRNYKESQ